MRSHGRVRAVLMDLWQAIEPTNPKGGVLVIDFNELLLEMGERKYMLYYNHEVFENVFSHGCRKINQSDFRIFHMYIVG